MFLRSTLIYFTYLLSWTTLLTQASPQAVSDVVVLNRRATICNGHAELCNRSFGNVTSIGTHNSYAIGTTVSSNQDQSVVQQLNDGIRMLQIQAHDESGTIHLCHSDCKIYDGGTLQDYLRIVKSWLDAHANEVLSILIVNIDNLPARRYGDVFSAVGLDTLSYTPPTVPVPASDWPTLGSLIDTGKRLITFMDNSADPAVVPYIIDEFSNVWETAYGVTDTFDCRVNRTRGNPSMYLINHFLDEKVFGGIFIPAMGKLAQTNAATGNGSVGVHVSTCVAEYQRPPNFILVDYYEYGGGSVFEVAASCNGVPYTPTPVATPSPTGQTPSVTSSPLSGSPSFLFPQLAPFVTVLFTLIAGTLIII